MKKIIMRFLLIAIFHCAPAFGQGLSSVTAPNAASIATYDNISVGLHTGVPNITVPLYSMPTLSKDLSVNLSLNYHPYSAAYNSIVGSGWSIPLQGSITRDFHDPNMYASYYKSDEKNYHQARLVNPSFSEWEGNDLFQLSAPGLSIRFKLKFINNNIEVIYADKSSTDIRIVPNYDSVANEMLSFTVYDAKGLIYAFDKSDLYFDSPQRCFEKMRSVWVLTKISNNNNQDLITYNYSLTPKADATIPCYSTTQGYDEPKLDSLIINGFGKIELTGPSSKRVDKIVVRDYNGSTIEVFDFSYTGFLGRTLLKKVEISNITDNNKQKYLFDYKDIEGALPENFTVDSYGFFKNIQCTPDINELSTDPNYRDMGLLEYITFPTGGMVKYEFEPNTYDNEEGDIAVYSKDFHNYTTELLVHREVLNPAEFIILPAEEGYYYVNLLHVYAASTSGSNNYFEIVDLEGNQPETFKTDFEYKATGSSTFSPVTIDGQSVKFTFGDRTSNNCQGKKIYLQRGTYHFRATSSATSSATIVYELTRRTLNNTINLWHYGNGVRIKSITQYEGNLYNDDEDNMVPTRKLNYSYNNFGSPNTSSGVSNENYTIDDTNFYTSQSEPIGYNNVTVFESGKGRTEYTFLTSDDFSSTNGCLPYPFWEQDFEKKRQVFDEGGKKISEISTNYAFNTDSVLIQGSCKGVGGYVTNITSNVKEYFYKQDGSQQVKSTDTQTKYLTKSELEFTKTSFNDGTEQMQYFYYQAFPVNFSTFTTFRFKPSTIEVRKNGDLISKMISEYSLYSGNNSYLPSRTLNQKGDNQPEANLIVTKYDQFDNMLEAHTEGGITTSVIYGYNKTKIIAKIANASYAQIAAALNITESQVLNLNESNIGNIDNLRSSLPQANVTTYTHLPLIGVSTIKDARGRITTYIYDGFGRLKQVKDNDGRILTENKYNYQPIQE